MSKYANARTLVSIFNVLAWIAIAIGAIIIVMSLQQSDLLAGIVIAAPVILGGVIQLGIAQLIAAQIDTAENTTEMVKYLRVMAKLAESNGGSSTLPRGPSPSIVPREAPAAPRDPSDYAPGSAVLVYKGKTIMRETDGFGVDGQSFGSVGAAKVWIDAEELRPRRN
ncbi:hypothetical protein LCM17_23125 [Cereibacter sphaeroides]|nr:hypothetical protein [Cereibacter sphaeroides]